MDVIALHAKNLTTRRQLRPPVHSDVDILRKISRKCFFHFHAFHPHGTEEAACAWTAGLAEQITLGAYRLMDTTTLQIFSHVRRRQHVPASSLFCRRRWEHQHPLSAILAGGFYRERGDLFGSPVHLDWLQEQLVPQAGRGSRRWTSCGTSQRRKEPGVNHGSVKAAGFDSAATNIVGTGRTNERSTCRWSLSTSALCEIHGGTDDEEVPIL